MQPTAYPSHSTPHRTFPYSSLLQGAPFLDAASLQISSCRAGVYRGVGVSADFHLHLNAAQGLHSPMPSSYGREEQDNPSCAIATLFVMVLKVLPC